MYKFVRSFPCTCLHCMEAGLSFIVSPVGIFIWVNGFATLVLWSFKAAGLLINIYGKRNLSGGTRLNETICKF